MALHICVCIGVRLKLSCPSWGPDKWVMIVFQRFCCGMYSVIISIPVFNCMPLHIKYLELLMIVYLIGE